MSKLQASDVHFPRPDRFIALPNVNGDAFVYQRFNGSAGGFRTVFVDGGSRIKQLECNLAKAIENSHVNVLVVTHGDADHTKGAQYILRSSRPVDEVWLPAALAPVLKDLIASPEAVVRNVYEAISEHPEIVGGVIRFLRSTAVALMPDNGVKGGGAPTNESSLHFDRQPSLPLSSREGAGKFGSNALNEWADAHARDTVSESSDSTDALKEFRQVLREFKYRFGSENNGHANMSKSDLGKLMSGAKRIIEIAKLVAQRTHPCKVRWFDVQRFIEGQVPAGGYRDELRPLNAVEIHPDDVAMLPRELQFSSVAESVSVFTRLAFALLSPSNAYGLVFEAPAVGMHPGVIFSGDSNFSKARRNVSQPSWPRPRSRSVHCPGVASELLGWLSGDDVDWSKWQHWMIVTAPHHGSPSNDNAYPILGRWFWPLACFFVRGTSSSVKGISAHLRALPHASTCEGLWKNSKSRPVELESQEHPYPRWALKVLGVSAES
jgi:hypothetical protein